VSCTSRVVLVDKPVGPTSFDIVRSARRGFRGRVGHAGTLDPFASGLLLLMFGQATKLSQLFLHLPKEYEMTVQFGSVSTTGDPTGEIAATGSAVSKESVLGALAGFHGAVRQRVPLTSAVKVGGERLYRKAHRGEQADTPEREVTIHDATMVAFDEDTQRARLVVFCGSGTYLRVFAQDLGVATGSGAYAASLRRTRIGPYDVRQALSPEESRVDCSELGGQGVMELERALAWLPGRRLEPGQARLAANGNMVAMAGDGRFRAYDGERLLGVYIAQEGVGRPIVVFPSGPA
jgi:tRNA pseudouridine55 synthase